MVGIYIYKENLDSTQYTRGKRYGGSATYRLDNSTGNGIMSNSMNSSSSECVLLFQRSLRWNLSNCISVLNWLLWLDNIVRHVEFEYSLLFIFFSKKLGVLFALLRIGESSTL